MIIGRSNAMARSRVITLTFAQIEKYTTMAEKAKDVRQRLSIIPEQVSVCAEDEEYEVLLLDERFPEHAHISSDTFISERKLIVRSAVRDDMELLYLNDETDSPWEREMKLARMLRKIYEQDCILRYVQSSCKNFDQKLDQLERDRLGIVAESVNINLFLLTLRQEYLILRKYETTENVLQDKVNRKSEEVAAVKQNVRRNFIDSPCVIAHIIAKHTREHM